MSLRLCRVYYRNHDELHGCQCLMVIDEHEIGILMENVDGWEGDLLFPVA